MNSLKIFRYNSIVSWTIKKYPNQIVIHKSTDAKKDLKEKLKMKTPIGNLK